MTCKQYKNIFIYRKTRCEHMKIIWVTLFPFFCFHECVTHPKFDIQHIVVNLSSRVKLSFPHISHHSFIFSVSWFFNLFLLYVPACVLVHVHCTIEWARAVAWDTWRELKVLVVSRSSLQPAFFLYFCTWPQMCVLCLFLFTQLITPSLALRLIAH